MRLSAIWVFEMRAVIFGANGGIGRAMIDELLKQAGTQSVIGVSRNATSPPPPDERFTSARYDMFDDGQLSEVASTIQDSGEPDLVIIATGFLSEPDGIQPERSFRQQSLNAYEQVFRINTFGPALIAKHMLPLLPRKGRSVIAFLSARVGSISDNKLGGWHAYRASKAALNMLIRNYAIELGSRKPSAVCVGLHPGTVDTALSQPFQRNLPFGQLTSPAASAANLLNVIEGLTVEDSGSVFDWKGDLIPA